MTLEGSLKVISGLDKLHHIQGTLTFRNTILGVELFEDQYLVTGLFIQEVEFIIWIEV
jgi:hypothetical protein